MGAAWLWARSDIRRRWLAGIALGLLVALAVGSVLALVAGARRADRAIDRFLDATASPELMVFTEHEPSAELLAGLRDDPRIALVAQASIAVVAPAPIEPGTGAFTIVGADSATGGGGRPLLVSGRYPDGIATDEIAINERAAADYGLRAGQRVPLNTIDATDFSPVPIGEATVVGVVRLAPDLVDDPTAAGLALAGPAFLDGAWRDQPFASSVTWLTLRDRRDAKAVAADVSLRVEDGNVTDNLASLAIADRATRLQRNALAVAAGVSGLIGVLVVALALTRHLGGRSDDPATLAAMGLTPRERASAGLLSVGGALAGGVLGGVGLAVAVSPLLPLGVARRADPDVGVHADWAVLVLGVAGAIVVVAAVASVVAARWTRAPQTAPPSERPSLAIRVATGLRLRPVPATGSRLALERGHGAGRLPVVPTLAVLTCAMAVVVGALVVRWSLDGLVAAPDRYGEGWDVRLSFPAEEVRAGAERLAADPRVDSVAVSHRGDVNLVGRDGSSSQVATVGLDAVAGPLALTVLAGRAPLGPAEIALASGTMSALGLQVGDRTTVTGACGSSEMDVVGRVRVPLTGGNDDTDTGSILTFGAVDDLCASDLISSFDEDNGALIRLRDAAMAPVVTEEWQAQGLNVTARSTPGSIASLDDIRQVPALLAVLVGALAIAAAAHALVLAVRRRQRDFAVLRALGLRPRQAGRIVWWQAATLAAVAVVVGLPFGLVLGRVVWTAIARPSNVLVHIDVSVLGLVVLVAAVAAIAAVLAIWPGHRAARLHPAAILRSE